MLAWADAVLYPLWLDTNILSGWENLGLAFQEQYPEYDKVTRGLATDPTVEPARRRHGGRWNVAFCDGHIENLRAARLFDLSDASVAERWNRDNLPHNDMWR